MISTLELTKAASQKEGSHYGATKGSDATEGPPADGRRAATRTQRDKYYNLFKRCRRRNPRAQEARGSIASDLSLALS